MVVCTDSKQLEMEFNNSVWGHKKNTATCTILESIGLDIDLVGSKYSLLEENSITRPMSLQLEGKRPRNISVTGPIDKSLMQPRLRIFNCRVFSAKSEGNLNHLLPELYSYIYIHMVQWS